MAKSYKKRASNFVKSTSKNVKKALPMMNNGLNNVSNAAKGVAKETIPIVEKGMSNIYGTINTGFNLGVKGAKGIGKGIDKGIKNMSTRKHKSGGRRRRSHTKRRKY